LRSIHVGFSSSEMWLFCVLSIHKARHFATTQCKVVQLFKLNIKKEMQGKCLSGLDLGFGTEMSC